MHKHNPIYKSQKSPLSYTSSSPLKLLIHPTPKIPKKKKKKKTPKAKKKKTTKESNNMGNATSCAPSIASHGATKVVSIDGTMELYTRPVKAAELMLENPGKFVCDAAALSVGHRIQGLSADDELLRRRLYFLLPMELLYSVLTHEEMTSFTSSSKLSHSNSSNNSTNGLASFGKNILPSLGEFCMFLPNNNNNNSESKNLGSPLSENCSNQSHNYNSHEPHHVERLCSKQRSWRPALETIVEAPTSSCRSH